MIPVKIQCSCGQRYAFEVEPVNGLMPSPVACPVCGADGTAAANQVIAQASTTQPAVLPSGTPAIRPAARALTAAQPSPARPSPQTAAKGQDGWAREESQLNKLGTYITVTPAILAALVSWGIIGIEIPVMVLWLVVGGAGLIGGALNIAGRGPVVAGACIGLLIALGGYGAVYWWIHGRKSVHTFEMLIAFAVGAAPGFLLQYVLQQVLRKRSSPE